MDWLPSWPCYPKNTDSITHYASDQIWSPSGIVKFHYLRRRDGSSPAALASMISHGSRCHASSALSAARGFFATMANSERAAGSGSTRPCSQLRNVASGILKARANSVCVIWSCLRKTRGGMAGANPVRLFSSWSSSLVFRRMSASVVAAIFARLMRGFIRRMFSIVRRTIAITYAPS
jgi:hypothetical protein